MVWALNRTEIRRRLTSTRLHDSRVDALVAESRRHPTRDLHSFEPRPIKRLAASMPAVAIHTVRIVRAV